jgi:hypothetical protein
MFHKYLFSGNRVVPYGQTEGQTNVTMLKVAFRDFTKGA